MTTASALPDVLSDAARAFAPGPHRLLIGGERPEAAEGRTFETLDPATGRAIADVAYAGAEDVDRAVRAAREAFEDGRWKGIAAAKRTHAMLTLADAIEAHADELAELESLDNGKPLKLAKRVDVPLTVEHLRYFAGWPTKIAGETLPVAQRDMHCYTRKEPVGVCAQIIPWNFPLLMSAWKIAPALAAGCTIVLKPAEQTPLTALRLGEIALEAGLPEGVLNVITGDGETGAALVDHDDVTRSPSPARPRWVARSARRRVGRSSG
jgi:acyl-CoA reductase-like NAD-dependent aldehyde dehydrogenase